MLGHIEGNPTLAQIPIPKYQTFRSGEVDAADAPGVHHNGTGLRCDGGFDIALQAVDVGEKQIAAEAVEYCVSKGLGISVPLQRVVALLSRDRAGSETGGVTAEMATSKRKEARQS